MIKPRICILAQGDEACEDDIEIKWSTKNKQKISACLFEGESDKPVLCWEKHRAGSHKFSIHTMESMIFSLRHLDDNRLLVEKTFEVVHDSKRYRRSRRNPWSFF